MAIPYSRTIIVDLPWYSVLIVLGMTVAILLAAHEEKRLGLPKDTAVDLALIVIPCGIVGARIYYVAMTWQQYVAQPLAALYIWRGGIAIYGAVLGGMIGAWVYAKRKNLRFASLIDMIAPGLLLAQAIGRWGNYFNMEAYGPVVQDVRFCFFPLAVLIPQGNACTWHMATFFYESVWNALGFAVLWCIRKRQHQAGNVFCWYVLLYGSGRYIIEQLRQDSLYIGALRVSQCLSLIGCVLAAAVLVLRAQKKKVAWLTAVLWIARWLCLEHPLSYALLMVGGGIMGVLESKQKRLMLVVLFIDALGLTASVVGFPFSPNFVEGVHAVLCSATLPAMLMILCEELTPKEGCRCRLEH